VHTCSWDPGVQESPSASPSYSLLALSSQHHPLLCPERLPSACPCCLPRRPAPDIALRERARPRRPAALPPAVPTRQKLPWGERAARRRARGAAPIWLAYHWAGSHVGQSGKGQRQVTGSYRLQVSAVRQCTSIRGVHRGGRLGRVPCPATRQDQRSLLHAARRADARRGERRPERPHAHRGQLLRGRRLSLRRRIGLNACARTKGNGAVVDAALVAGSCGIATWPCQRRRRQRRRRRLRRR
jgi:hypothetical protein